MSDRDKVIKAFEECLCKGHDFCSKCYQEGPGFGVVCKNNVCLEVLALLKEQETKWHVFHENEDGVMEVECSPNNGEQILWYRKYSNDVCVTTWDDDEWAEYACNTDGENFEDGDAWMELPSKPQ